MQAKGRLQCWNADGQELGGSCREGCAGKGQAATLEQQRLPARKSSTPAVVPGAAPALAKAGVGGFYMKNVAAQRVAEEFAEVFNIAPVPKIGPQPFT